MPRELRVREPDAIEAEIQRRVLLEQTRALGRALAGFHGTVRRNAGAGPTRSGRLGSRRTCAGRRHGLVLRDASAFSEAAREYARNAPWLERAAQAARRRREWWIRRFRPWDLPGGQRLHLWRDRFLAGGGALLLLAVCATTAWWLTAEATRSGSIQPAPSVLVSGRDLQPVKAEAERVGLAFLRARDIRERAVFLRPGAGGSRPVLDPRERAWKEPRIRSHWVEPVGRGLAGHWLYVCEAESDRADWVAVATHPSTAGAGWTGQIDAAAMGAYQTGLWISFLDRAPSGAQEVFRLLAIRESGAGVELDPDPGRSAIRLRFSDAKRERTCEVLLPRTHPAFAAWSAGDLAHGGSGLERRLTVALEKLSSQERAGPESPAVGLVSLLGEGWILP
ncbi:MAG TPA: hypothetical protein VMN36_07410 [Verrucomicrobiales bacterium]|nr:hypothetical protein [Verrucomicrobiales bacterium]